jgi:hypothetical protein
MTPLVDKVPLFLSLSLPLSHLSLFSLFSLLFSRVTQPGLIKLHK